MIGAHFREYFWFGLFFALCAPLQFAWALAVPRWLVVGAWVNLAIALVWVESRVLGLPIGPHPWRPESVGVKDLLASYDEIMVAVLVWAGPRPRLVTAAWVLSAASLVAAFLAGH